MKKNLLFNHANQTVENVEKIYKNISKINFKNLSENLNFCKKLNSLERIVFKESLLGLFDGVCWSGGGGDDSAQGTSGTESGSAPGSYLKKCHTSIDEHHELNPSKMSFKNTFTKNPNKKDYYSQPHQPGWTSRI